MCSLVSITVMPAKRLVTRSTVTLPLWHSLTTPAVAAVQVGIEVAGDEDRSLGLEHEAKL